MYIIIIIDIAVLPSPNTAMSSFNKNLLVAGFTLALLIVASHRATADCETTTTGIKCRFNDVCVDMCLQIGGGYTGGYCSTAFLYCVCTRPCAAQSMTAAPGDKQLAGNGDGGGMGMAN